MNIRDMDISARAKSCLLRVGYTDSAEIKDLSDDDLLAIKNINQNCVEEIRRALNCDEYEEIDEKADQELGDDEITKSTDFWDDPVYKIPIIALGLSVRAYKCLRRSGIDIVHDLCCRSAEDIMKVRNLGRKSLEEVLAKMKELGVNLRQEEDESLYGYPKYVKHIVRDKPDCWEHRLYVEIMILNYEWLSEFRKVEADFWKNDFDESTIDSNAKIKEFITEKLENLRDYSHEMSEAINEKVNDALGKPGEQGDVKKIISAAEDFFSIYRKWINWKIDFTNVNAVLKYHKIIEELYSGANCVLLGVDELYKQLITARKVFQDYDNEIITSDEINININLQVSFSSVMGSLTAALEKIISGSEDDDISSLPTMEAGIDNLELSIRSRNCLKKAGIGTLGDLCKMTLTDLMKVRNLGRKSCEEILNKLNEIGLSLCDEDEELDKELSFDEYPKLINVTSSNLKIERDNRVKIKVEAAYWKSSGKLYVPHLKVRVVNASSSDISSLKMKVLFYDINAKELWDDAYDTIISGDALKPRYNKSSFLSANVGYSNKISESSLPSISAQIFVDSKYYGTVDVDKSYSPQSDYLRITEGGQLSKYSFKKYDERDYGLIVTHNRWEKDNELYVPSLKIDVINQTLTTKTDISIKAVFYYPKYKKIWSESRSSLITSERSLLPGFKKTAFMKGTQGYSTKVNDTSLPELMTEIFVNDELYGQIFIKCSYDNTVGHELVTIRKDIIENERFERKTDQDFYPLVTTNCWRESGKLYVPYIKIDVTNQQEEPANDIRIKTVFMNVDKKEIWSEVTDTLIHSYDTPLKRGYKKTTFIKASKGYAGKIDKDSLPKMIAEVFINDKFYGEIDIKQSYDSTVVNQELRKTKRNKEKKYERIDSRDFYPILRSSRWENVGGQLSIWTGQLTEDLYAPCIQIDVINQNEDPVDDITVKAIFYDLDNRKLWSHTLVNLISRSETSLKQGYRKTAFLNASVGYRNKPDEKDLPEIAAEIYINDELYGSVMVKQSYKSLTYEKPLKQGELVFKNDFIKKNNMGFYPVIKERCWKKNSTIYAPYIKLDIMNQLEKPADSISLKAVFYDEAKNESWTEAYYSAVTSSVPLKPGFSVSAFLKGTQGYKSKITIGSLPNLKADIYINNIFYGSVEIKREYDGAAVEEPLVKNVNTENKDSLVSNF